MNNSTLSDVTFLVEGGNLSDLLDCFQHALPGHILINILSFLLYYQEDGSMHTEFVYLLLLMHFGLCLMVVTG